MTTDSNESDVGDFRYDWKVYNIDNNVNVIEEGGSNDIGDLGGIWPDGDTIYNVPCPTGNTNE